MHFFKNFLCWILFSFNCFHSTK